MTTPRLDRSSWPAPTRPVRIVHLGAGNFARAHQAWYTMAADGAGEWGISAFTGRGPQMAERLAPQQGLYTLIERSGEGDRVSVVEVISEVHSGADLEAFLTVVAAPETAVVTLTVTEAGYRAPAAESGDGDATEEHAGVATGDQIPTPPARLARALAERHRRGGAPLAIVSCDNLHANGEVLRERTLAELERLEPQAVRWAEHELSFVSTTVDRITPRTTDADRELVLQELGLIDAGPVVTEPFSEWVLCGAFPAGRPEWELAGARFVDDIEPWELRKLWLLNGAHSMLAYLGLLRGHATVADAVADPELNRLMDDYWDLAQRHLAGAAALDLETYRGQLRTRFANPRIGYPLTQIAGDGLDKLRNRVVPVIRAARAAGRPAGPALAIVHAWAHWLTEDPARADTDQNVEQLRMVLDAHTGEDARRGLLTLLDPEIDLWSAQ